MCNESITRRLLKNRKTMLINGKSSIHALFWNLPFQFMQWLCLLMLKSSRKRKFVTLIYHGKISIEQLNQHLTIFLLNFMIFIVKIGLHKQFIRIIEIKPKLCVDCIYFQKFYLSVCNCFRKQREE